MAASAAAAAKKQERQAHVRKVFAELFNIPDNKVRRSTARHRYSAHWQCNSG